MENEKLIEQQIIQIASELIETAKEDGNGMFWETFNRNEQGELFLQVDESLFGGTSGVVLFFIAAYQHFGDSAYLQIIEKATNWILNYCHNHDPVYVSLYSGRTGVIYLCCRVYEISGNAYYLSEANRLLESVETVLREGNGIHDLVSGEAGNLFVLTYLFSLTGNEKCTELIDVGIARIAKYALLSRQGIKWGYKSNSLDSLCGFSHGASGIAHVLLEMGRFFNSKALCWMAEQAFLYERQYYSKKINNWLDLRVYEEYLDDPDTLRKQTVDLLVKGGDVNSWAHGTTGIGLVRLKAFETLNKSVYKKEARNAIRKTLADLSDGRNRVDYNLCAGIGGWAELLGYGAQVLGEEALRKTAVQLAGNAVLLRQTMGYFPSVWESGLEGSDLMYGKSGVGYFLLRVLNNRINSVLLPSLGSRTFPDLSGTDAFVQKIAGFSVPGFRENIYGTHYARTITLLRRINAKGADLLFDANDHAGQANELTTLESRIRKVIKTLEGKYLALSKEIFSLEKKRVVLLTSNQGIIYHQVKVQLLKNQYAELVNKTDAEYNTLSFRLAGHINIVPCQWNWDISNQQQCVANLTAPSAFHPVMLANQGCYIDEYALSTFSYLILYSLRKSMTVSQLVTHVSKSLQHGSIHQYEYVLEKILLQLKQFSKEGLIELAS